MSHTAADNDLNYIDPGIGKQIAKAVFGKDDQPKEVQIKWGSSSKFGANFGGQITLVQVSANVNGRREAVEIVLKLQTTCPVRKDLLRSARLFEREVVFYEKYMGQMQKFVSNKASKAPSLQLDVFPKVHAGSFSEIPFLALENLLDRGFKSHASLIEGLDEAHCRVALENLARFHAVGYAMLSDKGKEFPSTEHRLLFEHNLPHDQDFLDYLQRFYLLDLLMLKATCAEVSYLKEFSTPLDKFHKLRMEDLKIFCHTLFPKNHRISVLNHGDFWSNNILFSYDQSSGRPVDMKMVDFQMCYLNHPVHDLHYFFYTSTTKATRDKHLNQLLRCYYDSFQATLKAMNQAPLTISYDELVDDFWYHSDTGLAKAVFALTMQMSPLAPPPSREDDLDDGSSNAWAEAVFKGEDRFREKLMREYKLCRRTMSTEAFRERIHGVLVDCFQHSSKWS